MDRTPFRVLQNAAMLSIARHGPTSIEELVAQGSVPPSVAKRYGKQLLEAVRRGREKPADEIPVVERRRRPDKDTAHDRRVERLKELRNGKAEQLSLDPGLLCPNGTLQAIARAATDGATSFEHVAQLRNWQRNVLGPESILLAVDGA